MALKNQYQYALVDSQSFTIAAGATTSSIIDCSNVQLAGILLPSNWTTANISFKGAQSLAGTLYDIVNFDGTALSIATVAASKWLPLQLTLFNAIPYIQIISSASQVSAVTVPIMLAPVYQGIHS